MIGKKILKCNNQNNYFEQNFKSYIITYSSFSLSLSLSHKKKNRENLVQFSYFSLNCSVITGMYLYGNLAKGNTITSSRVPLNIQHINVYIVKDTCGRIVAIRVCLQSMKNYSKTVLCRGKQYFMHSFFFL